MCTGSVCVPASESIYHTLRLLYLSFFRQMIKTETTIATKEHEGWY